MQLCDIVKGTLPNSYEATQEQRIAKLQWELVKAKVVHAIEAL
jgi:hypothetical protein